ncbi:MipA/OmpV family protein [Roseateles sp. BYS180W]|uniref:MipA/OmpV family protein n=1 Tax=Roseateles rivi TaxID=3299028 RepID=A0ABW7FZA6_9BURK
MLLRPLALLALLPLAAQAVQSPVAESSAPDPVQASSSTDTAAPADPESTLKLQFLVGAVWRFGPTAPGAEANSGSLKPLVALRWGRWRISSSSAGGMLGFGRGEAGPGASTELFRRDNVRLGLGLRMDSGRKSADSANTAGLSDVRSTARLRLYGSWALSPQWNWTSAVSTDILGRRGGMQFSTDISRLLLRTATQEVSLGAGLSAGNATYMNSYFGVPEGHARWATYQPGAGLRQANAGVGWLVLLRPDVVLTTGAGVTRLLGPAANSPMVERPSSWSVSMGLGYRY